MAANDDTNIVPFPHHLQAPHLTGGAKLFASKSVFLRQIPPFNFKNH